MRALFFVFSLLLGFSATAQENIDMRTYGVSAPVKIYLFTSLACPHCASFHKNILPDIQKKYLNNRKGQIVIVDMLMNQANLMGATLLRCLPKDQAEKIETDLYEHQRKWTSDEKKARSYLAEVAQKNGLSAGEFETCIHNKSLQKIVILDQEKLSRLYGISHMPTLLVRKGNKIISWEGTDKKEIIQGLDEFFK